MTESPQSLQRDADRVPDRSVLRRNVRLVLIALAAVAALAVSISHHTSAPMNAAPLDPDEEADRELSGAESKGCKLLRAALVGSFGASFASISPSGQTVFLRHPLANSLSLSCIGRKMTNVFLSKDGLSIPPSWYSVAGQAGAIVTGSQAKDVEALVRACITQAYDDANEQGRIDDAAAHIECQAFKRDGGNVNVSIYRP